MRHAFHPEALDEYEEAARFYSSRERGLEARFIDTVESAFSGICQEPTRWRIFEDDVRRFVTKVFPYAVLYTIEEDFVLIIAVMHCHREPGYWKHRMDEP